MEREIINYNEQRDAEGEEAFLKSLLVAFQVQVFDEELKFQVELRHTSKLDSLIHVETYSSYPRGQFFFFYLPLQTIKEWKKANHPSLKDLTRGKIVFSF